MARCVLLKYAITAQIFSGNCLSKNGQVCVCHTLVKIVIWLNFKDCHGADDAFSSVYIWNETDRILGPSPATVSSLKDLSTFMCSNVK